MARAGPESIWRNETGRGPTALPGHAGPVLPRMCQASSVPSGVAPWLRHGVCLPVKPQAATESSRMGEGCFGRRDKINDQKKPGAGAPGKYRVSC